ncbi:aminodeoxychorismate synthase component I [Glutamicibacter endophyticus]|uniref:aminodeoxychorismate synthase component I n=1 Tax=Glutamicibacter endophyticus TaxID=1522174 RepID=UPI003AEFA7ED
METAKPFIIALDGRSGAGKTSLAADLSSFLASYLPTSILHLEDFYPGWDGLHEAIERYAQVLPRLAHGQSIHWPRWDWERSAPGELASYSPTSIVIVEGVGAAAAAVRDQLDLTIWVGADETLRKRRAIARDGDTYLPYWERWAAQEERYLDSDQPADAADLVIDNGSIASGFAQLRELLHLLPATRRGNLPITSSEALPAASTLVPAPVDAAALFEQLAQGCSYAALLESTSHHLSDPLGRNRYTLLALSRGEHPTVLQATAAGTELRYGPGRLRLGAEFFEALGEIWPGPEAAFTVNSDDGPNPQWVGYLGYELKRELGAANLQARLADGQIRPDAVFFKPDTILVVDHQQQSLRVTAPQEHLDQVLAMVRTTAPGPRAELPTLDFRCADDAAGYMDKVRRAQYEIAEGNSYEVCLTTRLSATVSGEDFSPFAAYQSMRETSPAPFAHFLRLGAFEVASISPERFLSLDSNGRLRAEPIKGTRPRGATPEEDQALAHDLATHPKDRAENIMIVDLLRNDLSHHAVPGSVGVRRLCAVESYATVHQMVSTIDAQLSAPQLAAAALREAFPPGSMTGAPKLSTMAILDELEDGRARGLYSGAVGYLGADAAADFSVVIRTLTCDKLSDGRWSLELGLGGAITADSDPQAEWDEVITKSRGVLGALGTSFPA